MKAIILVDLDDTLFQTLRKCPGGLPEAALEPVGFARDGSPLSYSTPRQRNFLEWLRSSGCVVPVTARSRDALCRVRIEYDAAICAHGGMILLEGGDPDSAWAAHIAREAESHQTTLETLARMLRSASPELSVRVLAEDGPGLYLLIKHPRGDENVLGAAVDAIRDHLPTTWTLHRNGNNVALLPSYLGKRHAVAALLPRLREQYRDAPVIGIGDSVTDAPFMALCDYAMMPLGSQLAQTTLESLA